MRKKSLLLATLILLGLLLGFTGCANEDQEKGSTDSISENYVEEKTDTAIMLPQNAEGALSPLGLDPNYQYIASNENAIASSIVRYTSDQFLITHYENLRILNWETGEQTMLTPANLESCEVLGTPDKALELDKTRWNPTGLFYHQQTQKLYIANYNGHNILIGTVSDDGQFVAEQMIVAPGLVSPENVAVNAEGNRIAVADYDGNALFLFDDSGNLIWKQEIPLAHGVEISEDAVYCTSLQNREVIQFDYDGTELNRVGQLANQGVNAYMWPVALELYGEQLLVTDAHTGMLTLLDDQLNYITSIGANGPYMTNFNYPYAVLAEENALYITDTFKERVIQLDFHGDIVKQVSQEKPTETSLSDLNYVPTYPYSTAYLYEQYTSIPCTFFNPFFNDSDIDIIGGFSSMWFVRDEGNMQQVRILDYSSENTEIFSGSEFYSVWCEKFQIGQYEYYLFGSAQNNKLVFYNPENQFGGVIFSDDKLWCVKNHIFCTSDSEPKESEILQILTGLTENFVQKINQGESRYTAYIDTMLSYYQTCSALPEKISKEEFGNWVEQQSTQSDYGKSLFEQIQNETADADDINSYFFQLYAENDQTHTILENILLRTLCAAPADDVMELVIFQATDISQFYPDYTIENALDGDPYDDYVAMLEGEEPTFTLDIQEDEGASLKAMLLIWESESNFATDYTISFKKDGQEVYNLEISNQSDPVQRFPLDSVVADEITVTVTKFEGQNRILLRQLQAWE